MRFLVYGLLGWTMEILWTGFGSLLEGDLRMRGFSYLWMFPIYGFAVLLEPVHDKIRNYPWIIRGFVWTLLIFGVEFATGMTIKALTGMVPWDYTGASRYAVMGVIRLDYAPVWFGVGLIFERVHDYLKIRRFSES